MRALAVLFVAIAAGACAPSYTFTTDASSYAPGDEVRLTFRNTGRVQIDATSFDCGFAMLERVAGFRLERVPLPDDILRMVCIDLLDPGFPPGAEVERPIALPPELAPGRYLFAKPVSFEVPLFAEELSTTALTFPFEVTAP